MLQQYSEYGMSYADILRQSNAGSSSVMVLDRGSSTPSTPASTPDKEAMQVAKTQQLNTISRNIRYLRLKQGLSQEELAKKAGIDKQELARVERGSRNLTLMSRNLAIVLGVRTNRLSIPWYDDNLEFDPVSLEKMPGLTKDQKLYISETIRNYFGRLFLANSLLKHSQLPEVPQFPCLQLSPNDEKNASLLRDMFQPTEDGRGVIGAIENHGIFVCVIPSCPEKFRGIHGIVNGYPYIAINGDIDFRGILGAELATIVFDWSQLTPPITRKRAGKIGEIFAGENDIGTPGVLEGAVVRGVREGRIPLSKAIELLHRSGEDIYLMVHGEPLPATHGPQKVRKGAPNL